MRFIKLFTGLAGLVAVLAAVPVLVTGIALVSWAAGASTTPLPTVSVESSDRAVIATDIDVFAGDRRVFLPEIAESSLRATGDRPLFLGIGRTTEVDRYLAEGGGAPTDQTFWRYSSDGTSASVDWRIEPGTWTAVVMNADGSPGVDATIQAAVPSVPLRVAGGILAVLGVGIGTVGSLLVGAAWGGGRSRRSAGAGATATA